MNKGKRKKEWVIGEEVRKRHVWRMGGGRAPFTSSGYMSHIQPERHTGRELGQHNFDHDKMQEETWETNERD